MDLKEYFRDNDDKPRNATLKARRQSGGWWSRLMYFEKPTIAMVNGWCFGGAFTPLVSCDLAIAAEEANFGLSEINWGILPGGNVTRAVAEVMRHRDALYYIMTGELFGGRKAAEMGLVNEAVPLAELETRVRKICASLLEKNPVTLKAAKDTYKRVRDLPGSRRRLHLRQAGADAVSRQDQGARRGAEAVPRRQDLSAGARRLQARPLRTGPARRAVHEPIIGRRKAMKIHAAVARAPHSPFSLERLDLEEPREGEILGFASWQRGLPHRYRHA